MRAVLAMVLVAIVGACALVPRAFRTELPGRDLVAPLTVVVVDRAGIVTGVQPAPGNRGERKGVFQVPGGGNALHVSWLGGMCDTRTTFAVEDRAGTLVITETTDRTDACRLAAILREVAIGISRPVDPTTVDFEPALGR